MTDSLDDFTAPIVSGLGPAPEDAGRLSPARAADLDAALQDLAVARAHAELAARSYVVAGDRAERCCDSHNRHCEPPSELCCRNCTEVRHDTFPMPHSDGSRCVLADQEGPQVTSSAGDEGGTRAMLAAEEREETT